MHQQIPGSNAMEQDSHITHDSGYGNHEPWVGGVEMNHYTQTTMADYGGGYQFMSPMHGLPSESLNRMPPPPQPQPMVQPHQGQHQLPMLITSSHTAWPSMLTHPLPTPSSYSAPPVGMTPLSAGTSPSAPPLKANKPMHTPSQPRKTLTNDDRRRMCLYAEEHPRAKQTDIGAMFGVERSTVSKVLRHKEKFLYPDDRSTSPMKRAKGKFPDIEKALSNWMRNAQKSGAPVTDAQIKEKFAFFATSTGNSDVLLKSNQSSWLEKFKQKHGIMPGKLMRRASEPNIPDSLSMSSSFAGSQPSSAISPSSPSGNPSPSTFSPTKGDEDKDGGMGSLMDFTSESGSAISPTATFTFSPDTPSGGFLGDHSRHFAHGHHGFQRPRSATLPALDLESMNQSTGPEMLTPKYHVSSTAPSSALDSPMHELSAPHFSIDTTITSPVLRHSSSSSSLAPRSTGTPVTGSGVTSTTAASSPSSPREDIRRVADKLLTLISNKGPDGVLADQTFMNQDEYLTILRWTERMRLQQHQPLPPPSKMPTMGGLARIPEGEVDVGNMSMKPEAPMAL